MARWPSVALLRDYAFVAFTIIREHGGRFLSSGMSLRTLCLRCTRRFVSVAWRSSSIAFLLVPLPPFAFLVSGFPPSHVLVFFSFWGLGHFTSTGLLTSV